MTIPTFTGYDTALRGLEAQQLAIDTTGENIDNAGTPGYSREVVSLAASTPLSIQGMSSSTGNGLQLGSGVDADAITRVRNQFLDVQFRAQNTLLGAATANQSALSQAQDAFAEPGANGISASLTKFYGDWNQLADSPTSTAAAETVVNDASALADQFNQLHKQLSTVQTQAGQELSALDGTNGELEQDANQIASLNGQIAAALGSGQTPNTLLDQRDKLIDDLSSLGSVSVTDPGNGLLQVTFGGSAPPLIDGTTVNWPPPTPTAATGGKLGALAGLSDTTAAGTLTPYLNNLDTVANDLITTVNGITSAGTPAYTFFSGTDASTIAVNATTTASTLVTSGDNSTALAVSQLPGSASDTAGSAYGALVAQIGTAVQTANTTQSNAQLLTNAVSQQRQSVSGVSLDEEMANLLTFQQGYQAAARALNTLNSVISTLINQT